MRLTEEDVEQEQVHFMNVLTTFRSYVPYSLAANNRRRKDLFTLPLPDQEHLTALGYKEKLDQVDKAILVNGRFLDKVVVDPEIFGYGGDDDDEAEEGEGGGELGKGEAEGDGDSDRQIERISHTHTHEHGHEHGHGHGHGHGHEHNHDHPRHHKHSHSHSHSSHHSHHKTPSPKQKKNKFKPTEFDLDKLRSTLKQLVRDWSSEGFAEREASYGPIKDALLEHFVEVPVGERRNFRVLVPGTGLGRLAYDVASLGFTCQGNEFSHYMLLASYLILNKTTQQNEHTIHPYIHTFSNSPSRASLLREVKIPDVVPTLPRGSGFSLVAGDFEEIYGSDPHPEITHVRLLRAQERARARERDLNEHKEDEHKETDNDDNEDGDADENDEEEDSEFDFEPQMGLWDAVLTCFFIDTAKNIVNYLRVIHRILAPGGVWINLGPLLWHWENNTTNDPSIELDLEEVKALARNIGFEIQNEKTIDATYTTNSEAMLGYTYKAAFWTAKKVV